MSRFSDFKVSTMRVKVDGVVEEREIDWIDVRLAEDGVTEIEVKYPVLKPKEHIWEDETGISIITSKI